MSLWHLQINHFIAFEEYGCMIFGKFVVLIGSSKAFCDVRTENQLNPMGLGVNQHWVILHPWLKYFEMEFFL